MFRCLILLMSLIAALAALEDLDPTPLRWTAGERDLGEAVALLQSGGNRVLLAEGVDDRLRAHLPAVDGAWWDGVAAICTAFAVQPDDGEASEERLEGEGTAIPVGHGTVVLAPVGEQPLGLQVVGGLLACVSGGGQQPGVRLWLRAEPRLPRQRLAWARATQVQVATGNDDLRDVDSSADDDGISPAPIWRSSQPQRLSGHLTGNLRIASLEPWKTSVSLTAGKPAELSLRGQMLPAMLVTDPAVTEWQGAPLPERRPLILFAGPKELQQGITVRARSGDTDLPLRGGTTRPLADERILMIRYLRAIPEGAIELQLEGRTSVGARTSAIRVPIPGSPANPPRLREIPGAVQWPAGNRPLAGWLALLSASGNPVLPEVGVDTAAPLQVAAVRGSFWDGVLAVATASGLVPDPGREGTINDGAVRLVTRSLPGQAACGPLLLSACAAERSVEDGGTFVTLRLALNAEPQIAITRFGLPTLAWSSWASDDNGGLHQVISPTTTWGEDEDNSVRWLRERRGGQASPRLVIRLSDARTTRLHVSGLLLVPRVTAWKSSGEIDLRAGAQGEMLFGPRAVSMTVSQGNAPVNGMPLGAGLLLRGLPALASLSVGVTLPDGQAIPGMGEAQRMGGQNSRQWFWNGRLPPEGRVTVELSGRAPEPPLALPVSLSVRLP
jgi:hypothetical protein